MSGPQLSPAPIEPEKSWFSRHLVFSIVMLVVVAAVGFVAALLFGVLALIKSSDAYQQALAKAQDSPAVVEALGKPVKPGWWMTGSINVNGSSGNADIAFPISGPKGAGTVYAVATKQAGQWRFKRLEVAVQGQAQRIVLTPGSLLAPGDIRDQ